VLLEQLAQAAPLFAGAGFALDEYRRSAGSQAREEAKGLSKDWGLTDHGCPRRGGCWKGIDEAI
jgi:hypothetical protein